jgi:biopolymer transport protein ExbD
VVPKKTSLALDVHHQIQDTDIDVFAETDEQVIIVQVKSSLSSKLEDNKSILKNFEKTLKHLQNKTKKHRMILFLMHSEIPDSEIGTFLLEDIKVEEPKRGDP